MRLLLAAALVALSTSSQAAELIPNWVKSGLLEEIVVTTSVPTSLVDLTAGSDLIVEATVLAQRGFLDRDGTSIFTDYRIGVTHVLKVRDAHVDPTLTVRRRGGAVPISGGSVVSSESGFPAFQIGDHYVLFLRKSLQPGVYEIVSGRYGATRIIDGAVTSTAPLKELVERVGVQPAPAAQAAK